MSEPAVPMTPYEPPHAEAAPPKTSTRRTLLIIGGTLLGVLCLLLGTCTLLVARTVSLQGKELTPLVDGYLTKVAAGDYRGAYADCGKGLHAVSAEADYVSFEQGIHDQLGNVVSKKVKTSQSGTATGASGRWAHTIYDCQFEKGPGTIDFKFQMESGVWKIVGVHYTAPALDDFLKRK